MQLQSGEVQLLLQILHPVVKQLQGLGGVRHRRTRLQVGPRVVKRKETTVTRGFGQWRIQVGVRFPDESLGVWLFLLPHNLFRNLQKYNHLAPPQRYSRIPHPFKKSWTHHYRVQRKKIYRKKEVVDSSWLVSCCSRGFTSKDNYDVGSNGSLEKSINLDSFLHFGLKRVAWKFNVTIMLSSAKEQTNIRLHVRFR